MHVLYASDENYIRHAAASMVSVMESNRDAGEIVFHLMDMNVSAGSLQSLRELTARYGRSLQVHDMGNIYSWFDFSVEAGGFGAGALARLFAARVLPEEVHRVLYLDCDTVVIGSLEPLFSRSMNGKILGMVAEPTVTKERRARLGLRESSPYCNSGVLLIDMDAWRTGEAERRVMDCFRSFGGKLTAPDQDALNCALQDDILQLEPMYNYGSVQIYYPWKTQQRISSPTPFYSREEYARAAGTPVIVHFLGEERPWRAGNRHPYAGEYDRCLAMTPWKDTPKEEGWRTYFRCFYLFNALIRPFPYLRWRIIDALIPAFLRHREKQRKRQEGNQ